MESRRPNVIDKAEGIRYKRDRAGGSGHPGEEDPSACTGAACRTNDPDLDVDVRDGDPGLVAAQRARPLAEKPQRGPAQGPHRGSTALSGFCKTRRWPTRMPRWPKICAVKCVR